MDYWLNPLANVDDVLSDSNDEDGDDGPQSLLIRLQPFTSESRVEPIMLLYIRSKCTRKNQQQIMLSVIIVQT